MTQLASANMQKEIASRDIDSPIIELYVLDCTKVGGNVHYLTPNINSTGAAIVWQGLQYIPCPITSSGWEASSDGSQPQPTLTVSNVTKLLQTEVQSLGDIVGATLTRTRTLQKFLDNGSAPDSTAAMTVDSATVAQLLSWTNEAISWKLMTVLDRFGIKLPRRQILVNGDSRYGSFPGAGLYRAAGT